MAKLIDLTGATITFSTSSIPKFTLDELFGIFFFQVITSQGTFHQNWLCSDTSNDIAFSFDSYNVPTMIYLTTNGELYIGGDYCGSFISFNILGDDDNGVTTNQQLIQWFIDNNATIEGGVWEEEKPSLIIKNPVCLIGSKAKKVIVDNVNMTIDVWTKEVSASLINFTIEGTSYQAEEGMTWSEWCNSDYNTGGYRISTNNIVSSSGSGVTDSSNVAVYYTDKIVANATYKVLASGGA